MNNYSIGPKQYLAYGMGNFASQMSWTMVSSYLTIFYTDVFGLAAGAVSVLFLIARIWDGCTDVMMGEIMEQRRIDSERPRRLIAMRRLMPLFAQPLLIKDINQTVAAQPMRLRVFFQKILSDKGPYDDSRFLLIQLQFRSYIFHAESAMKIIRAQDAQQQQDLLGLQTKQLIITDQHMGVDCHFCEHPLHKFKHFFIIAVFLRAQNPHDAIIKHICRFGKYKSLNARIGGVNGAKSGLFLGMQEREPASEDSFAG